MIAVNPEYTRPPVVPAKPPTEGAPLQLVVFNLGAQTFALPVSQVREVVRLQPVTPLPKAPAFVEGVIQLRGRVLPVADLRARLDLPRVEGNHQTRIVVLRRARVPLGIIVDAVQEVVTISASTVQKLPVDSAGALSSTFVTGIARVGERLLVLLNIGTVFPEE